MTDAEPPWLVTGTKIADAVRCIVEVARPEKVILFGSAARGDTNRDSDADFLVVLKHVDRPREESVRIRRALRSINMPVDIVVVGQDQLRTLGDHPGLVYREAIRHGRVLYDRAA